VSGAPNLSNRPHARTPTRRGRNCRRFFIDRAHRFADSLQIDLNIEAKALRLPAASTFPA
jgi:hypothetical protein